MIVTQWPARITVQPRRQMGFGAGKMGVMGLPVAEIRRERSQSGNIPLGKHAKTLDLSALDRQSWRYLYQFEALPVASVRFFERGEGGIRASGPACNPISIRPREIFRNATRPAATPHHRQGSKILARAKKRRGAEPIPDTA